ncbi:hypothetical protein DU475_01375 [Rhodopseudomonas sp. WA056]|nr:hypothetical protein [Rhodopseudomonas sp. WA056]
MGASGSCRCAPIRCAKILRADRIAALSTHLRHGRACPGHPRLPCSGRCKAWMPGTRPGMTWGEVSAGIHRQSSLEGIVSRRAIRPG